MVLSCTIRSGSAQVQATHKSKRLKHIQSQGAHFASDVWKTSDRAGLTEDEKVAGLSKLWSEVKYNFGYFDRVPDLDWDNGKEFVGVGIQPDIVVRQTIADLRAGRDTVLQAALKELKPSSMK